jgi:hypothetical protein
LTAGTYNTSLNSGDEDVPGSRVKDCATSYGKSGSLVLIGVVICLVSRAGRALVNYSKHPDLAKAMESDPQTNGGDMAKADRAIAAYRYLKYLKDVNDSFQKAHVYCQLGALYAVSFNKEKGEDLDCEKARRWRR